MQGCLGSGAPISEPAGNGGFPLPETARASSGNGSANATSLLPTTRERSTRRECGRATGVGTDVRAARAWAAGSPATHLDSVVDSPSGRQGRIECVRGVGRQDRPPEGSACARSMRADASRRAGSGTWRASGSAPGARPTSVGSSCSRHSRLPFDHLERRAGSPKMKLGGRVARHP